MAKATLLLIVARAARIPSRSPLTRICGVPCRWAPSRPFYAVARRRIPTSRACAPDEIDYNWHVRPILSENCFSCHGPDPSSREAGLRLDIGELAVQELPETPGKLRDRARRAESQRDRAPHPFDRMSTSACRRSRRTKRSLRNRWPSSSSGSRTAPSIGRIGRSSSPRARPSPETALAQHAANDIDRFVLGRLEREGLEPPRPLTRKP